MARPPSRQLASVKHELYHPYLPTLRRMDMDTVSHKLTNEHSRHTTYCSREAFVTARSTLRPKKPSLHCASMSGTSTKNGISNYEPISKRSYTNDWNKILNDINSFSETSGVAAPEGMMMRQRHPDITSSWQTAFAVKRLGGAAVRPVTGHNIMPATMYSRYRNTSRPYSSYPWY